jgi:hypothetical protein
MGARAARGSSMRMRHTTIFATWTAKGRDPLADAVSSCKVPKVLYLTSE